MSHIDKEAFVILADFKQPYVKRSNRNDDEIEKKMYFNFMKLALNMLEGRIKLHKILRQGKSLVRH